MQHIPSLKPSNNAKIRQRNLLESQANFKQVGLGILEKIHADKQSENRVRKK